MSLTKEQTIKSDKIYDGKLINLRVDSVELPDRRYSKREIVEHPGVAVIIAIKGDMLLLTKQYRKSIEQTLLEVPAGIIEANETPLEAAKREFLEETSMESADMEFIFSAYSSPGYSTEKMYFFITREFNLIDYSDKDPDIELSYVNIETLGKDIENLDVVDLKTITSYWLARNYINARS